MNHYFGNEPRHLSLNECKSKTRKQNKKKKASLLETFDFTSVHIFFRLLYENIFLYSEVKTKIFSLTNMFFMSSC